jgi:hypothetical protein
MNRHPGNELSTFPASSDHPQLLFSHWNGFESWPMFARAGILWVRLQRSGPKGHNPSQNRRKHPMDQPGAKYPHERRMLAVGCGHNPGVGGKTTISFEEFAIGGDSTGNFTSVINSPRDRKSVV